MPGREALGGGGARGNVGVASGKVGGASDVLVWVKVMTGVRGQLLVVPSVTLLYDLLPPGCYIFKHICRAV